jgi:diacylglycerol O-acyltransferase-1
MAYFVIAPTLVYEPEYPRTPRIRRRRLVFLLFKAIVLTGALLAGVQQYITPLGNNSIVAIRTGNIVSVVERVLKLAVPNMMIWLVGFYVVFHLQLNIVAEVTRFADRLFYRDWWNSSNLDNFWRTWNLPVHNWIKHTVYLPLVSAGVKR